MVKGKKDKKKKKKKESDDEAEKPLKASPVESSKQSDPVDESSVRQRKGEAVVAAAQKIPEAENENEEQEETKKWVKSEDPSWHWLSLLFSSLSSESESSDSQRSSTGKDFEILDAEEDEEEHWTGATLIYLMQFIACNWIYKEE